MIIHGYSEEELKKLPNIQLIKKRVEEKRKEKEFNVVTSFGDGM